MFKWSSSSNFRGVLACLENFRGIFKWRECAATPVVKMDGHGQNLADRTDGRTDGRMDRSVLDKERTYSMNIPKIFSNMLEYARIFSYGPDMTSYGRTSGPDGRTSPLVLWTTMPGNSPENNLENSPETIPVNRSSKAGSQLQPHPMNQTRNMQESLQSSAK